jgi:hypothetical protein
MGAAAFSERYFLDEGQYWRASAALGSIFPGKSEGCLLGGRDTAVMGNCLARGDRCAGGRY